MCEITLTYTGYQALVKMAVILLAFLHSFLISYIYFLLTFLKMKLLSTGRVLKELCHMISDGPLR